MKVSVIVPVYNAEKYLNECIDSILAQTHAAEEIILVDDGSTDRSGAICDEYASHNPQIKVIHQPNQGLSVARNVGIGNAKYDHVTMIDSDDVIHPRYLESLSKLMQTHDASVAVVRQARRAEDMKVSPKTKVYSVADAIDATLYQNGMDSSLCAKLFKTEILRRVPQRPGKWYEDLDAFYRIYEASGGNIVCNESSLYFYRPNPQSFIHTFSTRRLHVLEVVDRIEDYYQNDPRLLKAARDRKFSANCNMYILTSQAGLKKEADKCWDTIRRYRGDELKNHRVRLKNKLGALLSYLGPKAFAWVGRHM